MPVIGDFSIIKLEDGILYVELAPPVAIGGMALSCQVTRRFGGTSGLIQKSVSSGFNGASGISVINSGQGMLSVAIRSQDTSGLDYGNYAFSILRTDSGSRTVLTEGFFVVEP